MGGNREACPRGKIIMIENIKINNFKSLVGIELTDCRRYNLLLGRPNVGKSNILEALSLFSVPYLASGIFKT